MKRKYIKFISALAIVLMSSQSAFANEIKQKDNTTNTANTEIKEKLDDKKASSSPKIVGVEHESFTADNVVAPKDIVNIPDANLKAEINIELNKESKSDITKKDLEKLTELNVIEKNITNLEGLQYAVNLKELVISYNNIKDLKPILSLPKLNTINADSIGLKEIPEFKNPGNIINLNLHGNEIESLKNVEKLKNLESLEVGNNKISNIEALKDMIKLKILCIANNKVSDISVLKNLKGLTAIYLDNNNISDITALKGINALSLKIDNNKIADLSPLKGIKADYLSAIDNYIVLNEAEVKNGILTINNPLKDVEGVSIEPKDITDGGVYDSKTNTITWKNLKSISGVRFFIQGLGGAFTGTVIQPVRLVGEASISSSSATTTTTNNSNDNSNTATTTTTTDNSNTDKNKVDDNSNVNTQNKKLNTSDTDKTKIANIKAVNINLNKLGKGPAINRAKGPYNNVVKTADPSSALLAAGSMLGLIGVLKSRKKSK